VASFFSSPRLLCVKCLCVFCRVIKLIMGEVGEGKSKVDPNREVH
jgi:hypothetical protein